MTRPVSHNILCYSNIPGKYWEEMGSKENFVFGEKNLLNTIRVTFPHFPSFRYTHCYTSKSQTTIGFGQWVSGCSMKLKITIHMFSELAKSTCLKKHFRQLSAIKYLR